MDKDDKSYSAKLPYHKLSSHVETGNVPHISSLLMRCYTRLLYLLKYQKDEGQQLKQKLSDILSQFIIE